MARPKSPRSWERRFWREVRAGLTIQEAAAAIGVSKYVGYRWVAEGGGMPSGGLSEPCGWCLSFEEREELAVGLAAGESMRSIAARLNRSPSTVSREIQRNGHRDRHRVAPRR